MTTLSRWTALVAAAVAAAGAVPERMRQPAWLCLGRLVGRCLPAGRVWVKNQSQSLRVMPRQRRRQQLLTKLPSPPCSLG